MRYKFSIEKIHVRSNTEGDPVFMLDAVVVSAMMSFLQISDALDTEEQLSDNCFNRIWLKSELTPARAEEIYRHLLAGGAVEPIPTQDEIVAFKQAQQEEEQLLSRESSQDHQVPIHKFATNTGWWITPKECGLIAKVFSESLIADNPIILTQLAQLCHVEHKVLEKEFIAWGRFNAFAEKQGGYRVN